ncbi:MAG TPA: ATP-binding protein [Acidobacteriaceae bacterium]|jgi:signal transduction histidine kinase
MAEVAILPKRFPVPGLRVRPRSRWTLFLTLVFLIAIPFLLLWQVSLYVDALLVHGRRITATREATRRAHDLLDGALSTYIADLTILANGQNLHRLAAGDLSARDAVEKDFEVFSSAKKDYVQIRFLDASGKELVRIDRRDGKVVVVSGKNLQNKADRYFFQDSSRLPVGSVYLSPIDLQMDHGQVQTPWLPVLRLASPLGDPKAAAHGIVIVNVNVAHLITQLEDQRPVNSVAVQLLDSNGNWLAGVPADKLWGNVFGHENTMAQSAPEAWRQIASGSSGNFDSHYIRYAFQTIQPAAQSASREGGPLVAMAPTWKVLGVVPQISLRDLWPREDAVTLLIGIALVGIIAYSWSKEIASRQSAEEIKQQAEFQLIQSERLASLGSLVAGVAHEMGTPIGNAVTIASTLSEQVKEFNAEVAAGQLRRSRLDAFLGDVRDGTAIMLRGLERAAELVRHFKQVAVDQTSEKRRSFRLTDLVHDVVGSVQPQFRHAKVALRTELASEARLDSYPGLLEQVLLNLITNARIHGFNMDQDGSGGEVVVATRDLPSNKVEITVRDTGKGIDATTLKRIFEPFFTTQLGSGGSGLGLSIVFNIVTGLLGGTIRAESIPGQGTTMILCLPLSAPADASPDAERTYYVER